MAIELTDKRARKGQRAAEYRGAQTTAMYSDVKAEFSVLRSGCGVYDLDWQARVVLSGRDRVRWLNGMITNNIRDLALGRGVYAFLLNPQGHILGDLYAYNRPERLEVNTDQEQLEKIRAHFARYIIMDKVEVTNISEQVVSIGVSGRQSKKVLASAGLELPSLESLELIDTTWHQLPITVVRGDNPLLESYELWVERASRSRLWEALMDAGGVPVGSESLELLRIACGIPRYGQDIRERDLPQETGQTRALHFTKGCYIGQEIVERIRSRGNVHRKFTGFAIAGQLPTSGTKLQVEGKDVGEITSAASLPAGNLEYRVALGYIRREVALPGRELDLGTSQATVRELPFAEVFQD